MENNIQKLLEEQKSPLTESEIFKLYKYKQNELLQVQEKYGKDSYEAKNIIDIMEIIWYNLSEDEQKH